MDLGLSGKRCVILGGSRGIGLAIAEGLAREGAHVAICARSEASLRSAEAALAARGGTVFAQVCDVGDPAALATLLEAARKALGGVDVLVHNASALAVGPAMADWEASLSVDLMAGVRAADQVIPWMAEAGGGSILFVSSASAIDTYPIPDFGYTAAKAALNAHAKKLSLLVAPQRIRVNAILPGSTEFEGGVWHTVKQHQPELYNTVLASIPWGRMATLADIADVAVFLVSRRAGWITGEAVAVDGGQHSGMR